jgi:hypothetical protein
MKPADELSVDELQKRTVEIVNDGGEVIRHDMSPTLSTPGRAVCYTSLDVV